LDNHPFSELFYTFSSDLVEKAPAQTVSILIKQGQKLDPLKVINTLIIPNPSERLVSIEPSIAFICIEISTYNYIAHIFYTGFGNNQILGVQYSLLELPCGIGTQLFDITLHKTQ